MRARALAPQNGAVSFATPLELSAPRPLRTAFLVAAVYALVCGLYIALSSQWAAGMASNVGDLASVELVKGLAFIGVSALVLFGLSLYLLRRVDRLHAETLRHREALIAAERSAMVGLFAASLAHDLRNVLMVIEGHADRLHESRDPDAAARADEVEKASQSLRELAGHLVEVGRSGLPGPEEECRASDLVRGALAFGRGHAAVRACRVECDFAETPPSRLNRAMVQHMLLNLLLNAAEADPGGRIRIGVRVAAEGHAAEIEVHDGGPGIPRERRAEVFEPFVTSKGRGTGLGLLSVKACAEAHGGSVSVDQSPLGGARFRVQLPLRAGPPAATGG